jgi:hypothetical protein
VDALVFTGGIGENSWIVREQSTSGLEYMGVTLDLERNKKDELLVSTGSVNVLVIPTDEELAIARDTADVLARTAEPSTEASIERELEALSDSLKAEIVLEWARGQRRDPDELREWLHKREGVELSREAMELQMALLGLVEARERGKEGADD